MFNGYNLKGHRAVQICKLLEGKEKRSYLGVSGALVHLGDDIRNFVTQIGNESEESPPSF